jgi:hypothetical protein
MSRVHIYTVHVNPALHESYESAKFVEEGFSWKAFIFGMFWLLYQRLWWQSGFVILLNIILWHLVESKAFTHIGYSILSLGIHLVIGFHATDWLRERLKRKGYITADIVSGNSLLGAELRFFDRYFSSHPAEPFVA